MVLFSSLIRIKPNQGFRIRPLKLERSHGSAAKACLFAGGLRGTSTSYRRETVTTVQQTEKEGEEGKSEEKVVVLAEWTSKTGGTYTDDECETSDTGEEVVGVEK
ncbi:unnamed protein product [Meloidogyne enterolobii]|uniref:Uncharacterized protein n=1 Tax=Meloidogyne enterolobii TaxID=390850 RepID=A0ACB0Z8S9_MELEN